MTAVQRVLTYSVAVADRACSIIRQILSSGKLDIVEKLNENDLQTEADRSVQRCIVSNLTTRFPHLTVIGEEELPTSHEPLPDHWNVLDDHHHIHLEQEVGQLACPSQWQDVTEDQIVVWVDPLDGTKEFTQGLLDHVTVLIGIAANGVPAAGVVAQPYYNYQNYAQAAECPGRTLYALVGTGVVRGGLNVHSLPTPVHLHADSPGVAASGGVITTTRSHGTGLVREALQAMQPDRVEAVGGAGHKVLLLLEGRAHAYVFASPGCKKWDTCAPQALLQTLGGKLTDMHGAPLPYSTSSPHVNSAGVLATAPGLRHQWYVDRVPDSVRQQLS